MAVRINKDYAEVALETREQLHEDLLLAIQAGWDCDRLTAELYLHRATSYMGRHLLVPQTSIRRAA
jgi:hypothetical protein